MSYSVWLTYQNILHNNYPPYGTNHRHLLPVCSSLTGHISIPYSLRIWRLESDTHTNIHKALKKEPSNCTFWWLVFSTRDKDDTAVGGGWIPEILQYRVWPVSRTETFNTQVYRLNPPNEMQPARAAAQCCVDEEVVVRRPARETVDWL